MAELVGKSFVHNFLGNKIKFTVTRNTQEAIRVIIDDTIQAIWLPKVCLYIDKNEISVKSIDWKLKSREFKKKYLLSKSSTSYQEAHGKLPGEYNVIN